MICKKPYMAGPVPYGCGQCLPCRVNRQRLWATRMLLESFCHEANSFITLTYSEENCPEKLTPDHTKKFLARLRGKLAPTRLRFYLVGEYGSKTKRPHYHAALFGIDQGYEKIINETWGKGFVNVSEFNIQTAAYICKYVLKTDAHSSETFSRMSNRPGIGADAMAVVADSLHSNAGLDYISREKDVPYEIRIDGKKRPLGRYLRSKLREEMGMPPDWIENAKQKFATEKGLEVLAVYKNSEEAISITQALVASWRGQIDSVAAKSKIAQSRKGQTL